MPEQTPLAYLKAELFPGGSREFMAEWKSLSREDKDDLKRWAEEEMEEIKA